MQVLSLIKFLSIFSLSFPTFDSIWQVKFMKVANQFGRRIIQLRIKNNLLQRQVASLLEMDTPLLSKIERGERTVKRGKVMKFAEVLNTEEKELLILWLADKLHKTIEGEALADEALKKVSNNIMKSKIKDNSKDGK